MGAFDSPTDTQVKMHIFVADKGDYYDITDGLPQKTHIRWELEWGRQGASMSALLTAKNAEERAKYLNQFIAQWTGLALEVQPIEGSLPIALRTLLAFRQAVPLLNCQDCLDGSPDIEGNKVTFICENQHVWQARTLAEGDDPPVWRDDDDEQVAKHLSEFLVSFVLQELTFGSAFRGHHRRQWGNRTPPPTTYNRRRFELQAHRRHRYSTWQTVSRKIWPNRKSHWPTIRQKAGAGRTI
jgi:hypothetical protein